MNYRNLLICLLALASTITTSSLMTGCSSGGAYAGRGSVYYGVGFRGYYNYPWGRRPIYIGGGGDGEVDPDWGVEAPGEPVAVPLPEMGLPDFGGGMDAGSMDMDMGGFDW